MAKRFTDTDKWKREWFRKLSSQQRDVRQFVLDSCDHSGVWEIDLESVQFFTGNALTKGEINACFNGKCVEFDGKFFVPDFIEFQYGELKETAKPHLSIIKLLKKRSLLELYFIEYPKGIYTLKEKDTEKDKDKEKDRPDDASFLSAYLTSIDESPTIRSIPKQTKLLWLNLYGDHDFILRSVAGALPRYKNQPPSKQNAEVFFTDQLKFDWLHFQKIQKQNSTPGGLVKDL